VPCCVDCLPGASHCQRRLGGQPLRELHRGGFEVVAGDYLVGQPDPQRLVRVDDLAEQDQLAGPGFTDDAGESDGCPHVGQQPEAGLDQADSRPLGEDPKVARQGQLAERAGP